MQQVRPTYLLLLHPHQTTYESRQHSFINPQRHLHFSPEICAWLESHCSSVPLSLKSRSSVHTASHIISDLFVFMLSLHSAERDLNCHQWHRNVDVGMAALLTQIDTDSICNLSQVLIQDGGDDQLGSGGNNITNPQVCNLSLHEYSAATCFFALYHAAPERVSLYKFAAMHFGPLL